MRAKNPESGETPLDELAAAITAGAVRLAAATATWLRLVAEFDRRGGWHGVGILSCAHWLAWQCGLGPGAAREHVRVARTLGGLPRIEAAFAAGRLSYSKVRALTRVAAPDCEAELVEFALHATASQTERFCRQWRRADDAADGDARRTEDELTFRHSYDDAGFVTLTIRMPAVQGAAVLAAVEGRAERDARRERAQAKKALADHERTRAAGGTVDRDVAERCVEDAAIGRVRERTTARRITALAELVEAGDGVEQRGPGDPPRREVVVHADADVLADDTAAGRAYVEGGPALTGPQARRMLCEATVVGMIERGREPLDLGRRQRYGTKAQRRALLRRDGGCARPGCPETRIERLHVHHMRHWIFGGPTDMPNLVLLCDVDHGLVHEHDLVLSRRDGRLIVTAPDGTRLWGSADAAFAAGLDAAAPDPTSGDDAYAGVHPIDTTLGRRPPTGPAPGTPEAPTAPAAPEPLHRRAGRGSPRSLRRHRRRARSGDVRSRSGAGAPPRPGGPRAAHRTTTGTVPGPVAGTTAPGPLSASAESGRLDRILFPDGPPPAPTPGDAPYERLNMAWAIGALMDHREFVCRREAERGQQG